MDRNVIQYTIQGSRTKTKTMCVWKATNITVSSARILDRCSGTGEACTLPKVERIVCSQQSSGRSGASAELHLMPQSLLLSHLYSYHQEAGLHRDNPARTVGGDCEVITDGIIFNDSTRQKKTLRVLGRTTRTASLSGGGCTVLVSFCISGVGTNCGFSAVLASPAKKNEHPGMN